MAKTWLITGSSRGFGRYLVEAVLAAGDNVLATARNPAVLEDLRQDAGSRLVTLEQDVMKPEHAVRAVNTAFETFGHLDVLVNNAGYGLIGAFEEMTEEEFRGQSIRTSGASFIPLASRFRACASRAPDTSSSSPQWEAAVRMRGCPDITRPNLQWRDSASRSRRS